jgi:hypothetical protein
MRRTLSRPMFRKGGTVPRQGYAPGDIVKQIRPTEEEVQSIYSQLPAMPRRSEDRSLNDFLINFGLDLISRSPSGGIFQTAAEAAKTPFANYQAAQQRRSLLKREDAIQERSDKIDIINSLMDAKAAAVGSEGGSGLFSKEATAANIKKHMTELSSLITNQGDPDKKLSEAEFNQQKGIILSQLQSFTGENEALKGLYGNTAQIELQLNGIKSRLLRGDENGNIQITNPQGEIEEVNAAEYYSTNPDKLAEEVNTLYMQQFERDLFRALGLELPTFKAEGGMVEEEAEVTEIMSPQPSAQANTNLSFDELRARLPQEITDDIVVILAESPQALVEFADIQTQADVDAFNGKYGVNLVLPTGA